jgi:hypothetical protein
MKIEDGGGSGRKPSSSPPASKGTSVRSSGSKFALKNDGGTRRTSVPTSRTDGVRVATAYTPGSKFALKNDGGVRKPTTSATAYSRGSKFALKNDGGVRKPTASTSAYGPGSKFALKNDGGVPKPGPSASERLRAAGDGVRVATPYRPGSLFALKNDGTAGPGGATRPGLTDREALAIAGKVHDAMFGDLVGTREGQAFAALRGLSPAEARQVAYQYEIKYKGLDPEQTSPGAFQVAGSLLYTRLQKELEATAEIGATGHDWAQAQALLRGDTAKADAIALQTALDRPWLLPGGRADEILSVLRRAEPAERKALIEAFAKDFAEANHTVYRGMAGTTQVPGTEMPEYDRDPATLVMNVLKNQLGGGDWTEAVGLVTAAKYVAQPAVAQRAQGEAAVGRLYSLLDRPLPDRAAALEVLQELGPEERTFVQGLATGQAEPTRLGQLLQSKLTDTELQQATAYLEGDTASARAAALHEALTRTSPSYGYQVPAPDVAAAEKILGQIASDDERRALLAAFERQYHQDAASLIPAVVGTSRREVLLAQLKTAPTVLESGASTLAGLGGEAVETGIDYRANVLRTAIESRLVGVAEDDVRRAFSGLDAAQARTLAALPLRPGDGGGRTLGDELGQWYRAGGGGRFTLELQQMLDGDAAATGDRQQLIDEAQAQYTLETTGPLVGANDAIQRLFGNDARTVLDADAARLQAAEAALRAGPSAVEPTRADMAAAYMGTGLRDYRTAKDAATEAAKTVVTTVAFVNTTAATGGTAAAVWAPVLAGAAANVAASQLNGASNSWQDSAVAVAEGAASGLTLPGSAVTVRGGQYVVREAAEEGGRQVLRSVSRSVAQEAVERGLAEGAEQVLARGGQVILRDAAGRELTVQAFRPTLARAAGQNVAEGVAGSVVGDLSAGTLRGDVNPQQVATNAVLAAGTAGLFSLGVAGAGRLAETLRGGGATPRAGAVPVDVEHAPASSLPDQVIPVDRDIIEVRSLMARTDPSPFAKAGMNPPPEPLKPHEVDLVIDGINRNYAEQGVPVVMARVGDDVVKLQGRGLLEAFQAGDAERAAALVRAAEAQPSLHPELAAAVVRGDVQTVAAHLRGDVAVSWRADTASAARAAGNETIDLSTRPPSAGPAAAAPVEVPPLPPQELARLREQLVRDLQLDADSPAGRNWAFRVLGYTGEDVDQLVAHVAATKEATRLSPPGDQAGQFWKSSARVQGPSGAKATLTVVWQKDPASGGVRLHRVWAETLGAPTPPAEAADATMQAAFVDAMRRTGVSELGVRSSNPEARVWYGVGGGTGPVFPTKPGGPGDAAVNLGPAEVLSLNEARAAAGLPPLHQAFPDLPIPRLVRLGPDGQQVWVRQQMLGGARVVVASPVRDAQGRVIDGNLVVAVSDVDLAYARHADGHLLTDAEINAPGGLRDAVNAAYSASLGVRYEIVNHGAHFNGIQDARLLELHDLDGERYWSKPVHTFAAAANGYVASTSLGDAYRRLVDPHYVPRSRRGGTGHRR